jgi:hypothetical protein
MWGFSYVVVLTKYNYYAIMITDSLPTGLENVLHFRRSAETFNKWMQEGKITVSDYPSVVSLAEWREKHQPKLPAPPVDDTGEEFDMDFSKFNDMYHPTAEED